MRRQAYEVRKLLHDLGKHMALFTATHWKPHMRFFVLDYDIYRTDREDWNKGGNAIAVKTGIPHTCADLPPLLSAEATGACIPIGNTEIFLAYLYKSLQRLWSDTASQSS
jgi:hypothetical protein